MCNRNLLYLILLLCVGLFNCKNDATAKEPGGQSEEPKDISVFYVGHSLSDYIPEMLKSLSNQDNTTKVSFGYQSIPGSPLRWNYQVVSRQDYGGEPNCFRFPFTSNTEGLASGKYSHLVLTESVPRHLGQYGIGETYEYVDKFYEYARSYNPDIRLYLYEVWHCIKSGTPTGCEYDKDSAPFRQRLADDLPMWQSVITQFNQKHSPKYPMKLIPGGQAIAKLYDEIKAGRVPEVNRIEDVFDDNIHGNNVLRYLIACVHYAVLLDESPVGLSRDVKTCWGASFEGLPLSASLAVKLQNIAKETVCEFAPSSMCNTKN